MKKKPHITISPVVEITFRRPDGYDNANCPDCGERLSTEQVWMDDEETGLDWLWFGWACHDCCVNYELDLTPIPNE